MENRKFDKLNQLIEEGAEKKLPFVEIEPSNAVRATNFNNETICARNVFKAGATFITTDLKALALIPSVKSLIWALSFYADENSYREHAENTDSAIYLDEEGSLARAALTPFTDSEEKE